jgi:Ribbon-helix-helix protein, copG family
MYNPAVRRIQIHIDEALDEAAEAEAVRRGQSKAALIRQALAHELQVQAPLAADPWVAMIGWLDDGPVEDLDHVVYDRRG